MSSINEIRLEFNRSLKIDFNLDSRFVITRKEA